MQIDALLVNRVKGQLEFTHSDSIQLSELRSIKHCLRFKNCDKSTYIWIFKGRENHSTFSLPTSVRIIVFDSTRLLDRWYSRIIFNAISITQCLPIIQYRTLPLFYLFFPSWNILESIAAHCRACISAGAKVAAISPVIQK